MNFKDYVEAIGGDERELIGKQFYICDYRLNKASGSDQALRSVKPTLVQVCPAEEANKTIYYSNVYFRPVGKKGNLLKKAIAPFDNTGFRSNTGIAVNIFETLEECQMFYNDQLTYAQTQYKKELDYLTTSLNRQIVLLENMKIK